MVRFTKSAAVAVLLCSTPHASLTQADASRPGAPGAVDGGARQVTRPTATSQEPPPVEPQAAPLGTELQPEELERRKRDAERLPLLQVPNGQQDQER